MFLNLYSRIFRYLKPIEITEIKKKEFFFFSFHKNYWTLLFMFTKIIYKCVEYELDFLIQ